MKKQSRRAFVSTAGKASVAAGLMWNGLLPLSAAAAPAAAAIGFDQKPLPYAYGALEPSIDSLTMEIHYTKHAATYTKNLADACAAEKVDVKNTSLETLLGQISRYSAKMRNNGGGHYNHELFWQSMKAGGAAMPEALSKSIAQSFGSVEAFKTQFSDAAKNRFGSGWAWLVQTADRKLVVGSTPNQDNPLMDLSDLKGRPLLGLDVWEHAYYLKYQNKRADYITNWWNLVDWDMVAQRMSI